jgi:hypothetical protein
MKATTFRLRHIPAALAQQTETAQKVRKLAGWFPILLLVSSP